MRKVGVVQAVPNRIKRNLQTDLARARGRRGRSAVEGIALRHRTAAADAWITVAVARTHCSNCAMCAWIWCAIRCGTCRAVKWSHRGRRGHGRGVCTRATGRPHPGSRPAAGNRARRAGRWVGRDAALAPGELPWRRELEEAIDSSSDVSAHAPLAPAESEVSLARTQVCAGARRERPDWSAELSFADRGPGYSDMVSLQFRVGLPLFTRHRQNPLIAARLADARAQEANLESALRMHRAEIDAALAAWRHGSCTTFTLRVGVVAAGRGSLPVLSAGYGSGGGSLRVMLDALGERADLEVNPRNWPAKSRAPGSSSICCTERAKHHEPQES